ncbi:NAD(P)/FAD-dependent oxidoreductase [Candidatus Gracilibacteria bacterium]|nr:NAD(P)/FAD-dependent oxidoreductase [Candidatus Gracilibacteria bacterium]
MSKKVVVVGSGSGGLTAAIGLSKVGYQVTLIEKDHIGGDCTNYGCIPSKALLYRAHRLHNSYETFDYIKDLEKTFQKKANEALQQVKDVVKSFQKHESPQWVQSFGIKLVIGEAKFLSANSVIVGQQIFKFDKCVIATGSTTYIPTIKGIKDTPFLTNTNIFNLKQVPKHLTMIGNGPIGIELGEAFACLGSQVTVIGNSNTILNKSDLTSSTKLKKYLEQKKIQFKTAHTKRIDYKANQFSLEFEDGSSLKTEQLLIATGRQPNVDLDLQSAGIDFSHKGILVDKYTRTSNKDVYAIGDVVSGVPNFTHYAYHMGKTVVTNLTIQKYTQLPIHFAKYSLNLVPSITFTSLELAEAGYNEQDAIAKFGEKAIATYILNFDDVDRTITHNHEEGHIKLITKGFFGKIIGVSILSTRAGEILPEIQTMIANKKNILFLNKLIRAYPSYTSSLDNLFKEWIFRKIPKKNRL